MTAPATERPPVRDLTDQSNDSSTRTERNPPSTRVIARA